MAPLTRGTVSAPAPPLLQRALHTAMRRYRAAGTPVPGLDFSALDKSRVRDAPCLKTTFTPFKTLLRMHTFCLYVANFLHHWFGLLPLGFTFATLDCSWIS